MDKAIEVLASSLDPHSCCLQLQAKNINLYLPPVLPAQVTRLGYIKAQHRAGTGSPQVQTGTCVCVTAYKLRKAAHLQAVVPLVKKNKAQRSKATGLREHRWREGSQGLLSPCVRISGCISQTGPKTPAASAGSSPSTPHRQPRPKTLLPLGFTSSKAEPGPHENPHPKLLWP